MERTGKNQKDIRRRGRRRRKRGSRERGRRHCDGLDKRREEKESRVMDERTRMRLGARKGQMENNVKNNYFGIIKTGTLVITA